MIWNSVTLIYKKLPHTCLQSLLLATLVGVIFVDSSQAQQTIFNVPSADIAEKNSFFYQHQTSLRPWLPERSWQMTNNLGYGIGKYTEIDTTLLGLDAFAGEHGWDKGSALGLGFKSALPLFAKRYKQEELKFVFGELMPITSQARTLGSWSYAEFSGRLPKLGTRITAGINYGTKQIFNRNQFSYMLGYEHNLNKHWMLQGDWFSGTHGQSAFIPGIVYIFNNGTMLSFGYQIPNPHAQTSAGFIFELTAFGNPLRRKSKSPSLMKVQHRTENKSEID